MTNEVATTQGTALATQQGYDPFAQEAADNGARFGSFLAFSGNDGTYTYGPKDDKKELVHGTQVAMDPNSYNRGWICWVDGKPKDRIVVNILAGKPQEDEKSLPDHGPYKTYQDGTSDGWQKYGEIDLIDVNDETAPYSYNFFGFTKYTAFARFLGEYAKLRKTKPGQFPVVELGARKYEVTNEKVRKGTFKFAPDFKIVGWLTADQYAELSSAAAAKAAAAEAAAAEEAGNSEDVAAEPVQNVEATPVATKQAEAPQAAPTPASTPAPATARQRRFGSAG